MRSPPPPPLLAQRLRDLDSLAESDEAIIYPDRPLWMRTGTLATLRMALGRASDLPPEVREHGCPQNRILRLMVDAESEGHIRDILMRRVRYFLRRDVPAAEVSLLYDRLRTVFPDSAKLCRHGCVESCCECLDYEPEDVALRDPLLVGMQRCRRR